MPSPFFCSYQRLLVITTLAVLSVCAVAAKSHAQTFYTSSAAFQTAAPTTTKYDFENAAPTGISADPTLPTLSFLISGGNDPHVYAVSSVFGRGTYSLDGSDSLLAGHSSKQGTTTRIQLERSVTAFGVEVGQSGNKSNHYQVRLYKGDTQVGYFCDMGNRTRFFVGVTSDIPFDNVRITACNQTGSYTLFDNVQVGDAANTTIETTAAQIPTK